ncbi:MAG: hypothetical protein COA71_03135 [SAR86 cluster bacterium]|uniref:Uncharacterized protein n=1 Tax=SAR86 cluster bacterium TaxID=2030880 RepID=A0A2A5CG95_9GAMM|nr:MAG: hypothetical protein COA71_03135 [SAR86 cluster bacterium]
MAYEVKSNMFSYSKTFYFLCLSAYLRVVSKLKAFYTKSSLWRFYMDIIVQLLPGSGEVNISFYQILAFIRML